MCAIESSSVWEKKKKPSFFLYASKSDSQEKSKPVTSTERSPSNSGISIWIFTWFSLRCTPHQMEIVCWAELCLLQCVRGYLCCYLNIKLEKWKSSESFLFFLCVAHQHTPEAAAAEVCHFLYTFYIYFLKKKILFLWWHFVRPHQLHSD